MHSTFQGILLLLNYVLVHYYALGLREAIKNGDTAAVKKLLSEVCYDFIPISQVE